MWIGLGRWLVGMDIASATSVVALTSRSRECGRNERIRRLRLHEASGCGITRSERVQMRRRDFLVASAAGAATVMLTPSLADAAEPRLRNRSKWSWQEQFDADHHSSNTLPAPGDAALCHIQTGAGIAVYSTSGNGNTYRHDGSSFAAVGPGVWVFGPSAIPDGPGRFRYAGITSVLPHGNELHGFVHCESWDEISSIGQVTSHDGGWTWDWRGTVMEGVELTGEGFRGAESPRVVQDGDNWTMFFGNRHGNGRWGRVHRASAPAGSTQWNTAGMAVEPPAGLNYTLTPVPVWSTNHRRWLVTFASDDGWYMASSSDLRTFGKARRIVRNPSQGDRWYPTLLDPDQPYSGVVGRLPLLTGHRITSRRRGVVGRLVQV